MLEEHKVSAHDVGPGPGHLRLDEGLCHIGPVLRDEHDGREAFAKLLCGRQIVGEDRVAEQLAADPVRRPRGEIQEIFQLLRLHLVLDHDSGGVIAEECAAALSAGEAFRCHLGKLFHGALGPPLRIRGERKRRHIDGHDGAELLRAELLRIAPGIQISGAPSDEDDVGESELVDQGRKIFAVGQVVVSVDGL